MLRISDESYDRVTEILEDIGYACETSDYFEDWEDVVRSSFCIMDIIYIYLCSYWIYLNCLGRAIHARADNRKISQESGSVCCRFFVGNMSKKA